MKKALLLSLLALLAGCTSVDVSSKGKDMVVISNSGCYLFGCLPICSGDPDYPNQQVCNWFDDTVKLETNIRLLNEEVGRRGAIGVRSLASHRDDENLIWILLKYRVYKTSAELIRP